MIRRAEITKKTKNKYAKLHDSFHNFMTEKSGIFLFTVRIRNIEECRYKYNL